MKGKETSANKKKVKIQKGKLCEAEAYNMQTYFIHGKSFSKKWDFKHHVVPPMSCSATYRLGSAERGKLGFEHFADVNFRASDAEPIYIYDRLDEPVRGMLEENLAQAEGGESAVSYVTGMAAISAALGVAVKSGDEIICHKTLYGCTNSLLQSWYKRYNIKTKFVDMRDTKAIEKAVTSKTRVVYYETPANPNMELIDIKAVSDILMIKNTKRTAASKILSIVDNTFATPFCQRPLEFGADMVVHSLTKNIGGFGVDMGGVVVTAAEKWLPELLLYRKDFGGVLPPKNAWHILVYGLPTLHTRIKQQQKTAQIVAEYLAVHKKVTEVVYPGLTGFSQYQLAKRQMIDYDGNFAPGFMICFTLKGALAEARRKVEKFENYIADNSYCITLAVSLGQLRTLIDSPTGMTHAVLTADDKKRAGVTGKELRLSIGLETADDIIKDLERAFAVI